jgi:hypothetical protein
VDWDAPRRLPAEALVFIDIKDAQRIVLRSSVLSALLVTCVYACMRSDIVGLQQVKFLVMKLIYPCLNLKFDIDIVFMINYFFSGRRYLYRQ